VDQGKEESLLGSLWMRRGWGRWPGLLLARSQAL
jgi:hypothetical protein